MNISLYYAMRQYEMNEFQRKMAKKEELVGEVGVEKYGFWVGLFSPTEILMTGHMLEIEIFGFEFFFSA